MKKRFLKVIALAILLVGCTTMKKETMELFSSSEAEEKLSTIYSEKLDNWPVDVKNILVDTTYGSAHVLNWGNKNGEVIVMLHAFNVTSTSWIYQAEALADYNVFAIDYIGDVGMSRLYDNEVFPSNSKESSDWIKEVTDSLGLSQFNLVGASFGGYLSMEFARYYPETVSKLALITPIGLNDFPEETGMKFGELFGDFNEENVRTFITWCIGNNNQAIEGSTEYLALGFMNGTKVLQAEVLSKEEIKSIETPIVLILAERDVFVGEPEVAISSASAFPNMNSTVVDSDHMAAMEVSEQINSILIDFLN